MNDSFTKLYKQLIFEATSFINDETLNLEQLEHALKNEEKTVKHFANRLRIFKDVLTTEEVIVTAKELAEALYTYLEDKIQEGEEDNFKLKPYLKRN